MLTATKPGVALRDLATHYLVARRDFDRQPCDPARFLALAEARSAMERAFGGFGAPKYLNHEGHRFSTAGGQLVVTRLRDRPITAASAGRFGKVAWEVKRDHSRGGSDS